MIDISVESGRDHLDAFVHAEGSQLIRFAFLLTAGDGAAAEDLVQVVLLRLVERGVDDLVDVRSYARRAVVNEFYTTQRRAAVHRRVLARAARTEVMADPGPEDRDVVLAALRRLSERERTVIVLRFYEDLTDDEIAIELGCRRSTVRSLAHRAMPKLRAHLCDTFERAASSTTEGDPND